MGVVVIEWLGRPQVAGELLRHLTVCKVAGGDRWRKSKTVGEPSEGALQREIEKSMVEHLALENRQLREELAKVKQDGRRSSV